MRGDPDPIDLCGYCYLYYSYMALSGGIEVVMYFHCKTYITMSIYFLNRVRKSRDQMPYYTTSACSTCVGF